MIEAVQRLELGIDAYECKSARKAGPHRTELNCCSRIKGDDSSRVPAGADCNPRSIRLSTCTETLTLGQGDCAFGVGLELFRKAACPLLGGRWCKLTLVQVAGLGAAPPNW